MSRNGFTVMEMLVAISLGIILIAASVPAFLDVMRRAQHTAAVRKVLTDMRGARSKAIATGWDYRVVGYDTDSTGARSNHYRILARRTPNSWPDEESVVFESDGQLATPWVDLSGAYPRVTLDSDNPRFELTFDSRGAAPGAASAFNPLRLIGPGGEVASLTVSAVGGIEIQ